MGITFFFQKALRITVVPYIVSDGSFTLWPMNDTQKMLLYGTEHFIWWREGGFGERELSPQLAQFQL